jgi:hypothetical protein
MGTTFRPIMLNIGLPFSPGRCGRDRCSPMVNLLQNKQ